MQLPTAVVMVRPASFGFNPDTAPSFLFQREITDKQSKRRSNGGRAWSLTSLKCLKGAGVEVIIVEDKEELHTPDAVFPNNWVSLHHDGAIVHCIAMLAPSRRPERRRDVIDKLQASGFRILAGVIDLTHHEDHGRFLEGTGSVVFDHADHNAYASISPRTNETVLKEICGIWATIP